MMLVDMQGAVDFGNRRYDLTDPVIYCADVLRFKLTNLDTKGFKSFFATDECNE
jgi:Alpha-kinase family